MTNFFTSSKAERYTRGKFEQMIQKIHGHKEEIISCTSLAKLFKALTIPCLLELDNIY